ncbi:MAG: CaiB/BaiF CoA transferase family protein [Acetobacteraceae bacterium]
MDGSETTPAHGKGLAASPGALAGIKVIDLTRVLGGPYCTMVLSDHGAEVIKIEPPQGDEVRDWGPPFHTHPTVPPEAEAPKAEASEAEAPADERDASYYIGINRNKRALALDLGRPEGREVLLRLLDGADVLIENFKPGSMEKWGLGYAADLAPRFPGLIHCRISGFGADGPLGGLPGYDAILQAMTGLMSVNGDAATGPMRLGTAIVDMGTGLYSAVGILMALQERGRSGRGQYLDMALYDCGLALLHPQAANFFLNDRRPVGTGNPHPNLVPYDKFPTRTGEIFIASGNNGQFRKLAEVIGRPQLATDPRFADNGARNVNRVALTAELQAAFAESDGKEIALRLIRAGVPAGPVLWVDEAATAPHTAHRNMVTELGWYRGLGTPIKLSRTPGGTRAVPPRFGEHGADILVQHGFTPAEIAALQAAGVVLTERRR